MGDFDEVPGSWFYPGSALAIEGHDFEMCKNQCRIINHEQRRQHISTKGTEKYWAVRRQDWWNAREGTRKNDCKVTLK